MKPLAQILLATALVPAPAAGQMRPVLENWVADLGNLERFYNIEFSADRSARMARFHGARIGELKKVDFDRLSIEDQIDYLLLDRRVRFESRKLKFDESKQGLALPYLPFAPAIISLAESRQRMEKADPAKAAATLAKIKPQIEEVRKRLENKESQPARFVAGQVASMTDELSSLLKNWFEFHEGYDPVFTWWNATPYREASEALKAYSKFIREKIAGAKEDEDIPGPPVGREALAAELEREWIPYTPEEILEIGKSELAWCETEMKKASRELGFGDDWLKALDHVKGLHVAPGIQPELIKSLADEAEEFLDKHDLVTIPPLARETWRMNMMSPKRQLVNPFFTGGEVISVSFPVQEMTHDQKLMSMRGNNIHFARATVFHELIPGHHLQTFMARRYRSHRRPFATPFSLEGLPLYWEMLFWDMNFARGPEDRIGMLFWRMHRAARIIFSLSFHLGKMSVEECVDLLVKRVGHERDNAVAEVRRSFNGSYPPLYQAAYMLGGLQFRALRKEMVESGRMTPKQFHDRILQENMIPIELLRASMTGQKLSRGRKAAWRFYSLEGTAR